MKDSKVRRSLPDKKVSVNSRLPEEVLHRWHTFALEKRMNKENALAEIIIKGTKRDKRRA
jgi:hypothetical protein